MIRLDVPLDKDESFLSEIFASIDEGFIIVDKGKVKYVNDRASQILGFSIQDITEKSLLDFAASEGDRSTIKQYLDSVLHSREDIREISFWVIRKDGTRGYVHCHFHYPRGDPARYRYIILTDITGMFRAESISRLQKDLAVKVSETSDMNVIYKACLETLQEVGPFDSGVIFQIEGPGIYHPVFQINMASDLVNAYATKHGSKLDLASFFAGTPVYRENLHSENPANPFSCAAILPLVHRGTPLGIIIVCSQKSTSIPAETRKSLETVAAQIGGAIARARVEAALQASEGKFWSISEQMTDGVSILVDGKRVWVNQAYCKIFGYSFEESVGKGPDLIFGPVELRRVLKGSQKIMAGGATQDIIEVVGIHKSGTYIDLELKGAKISYNGVPALQTIFHDITERKKAERELRDSEAKFRLISENVGDIVVLLDENLLLLYGNERSIMEKLGLTLPELAKVPVERLVHPDDQDEIHAIISHLENKRQGFVKGEIRFCHKDGRFLWFWVEASTYFDASGRSRGLITARDIHEKKEQDLRLAESEKKYRLISENSNDVILVIDEKAVMHYANEKSLYKLLGYKVSELAIQRLSDLLHPDEYLDARKTIAESFDHLGKLYHKELRFKAASQDYIWFDFDCLGFIDENQAKRLLLVGRNIQERKEQELKLKASEEKYRLLLESTNDIIFLYDKNLNILYANEQVLFKKLEYGVEEFAKNRISEIVHPEDVIALFSAINYVKTRPLSMQQREVRLKHKNGHHRWFNAEFFSSIDLTGQLRIIGTYRDIHDKKLQSLKLKQSEERYRLISENSNDIILLLDTKLSVVYCNERALLKKLGFLISEFDSSTALHLIHPDDYPIAIDGIHRLLEQPGTQAKQECRLIAKDGRYIWFDIEGTSYIDEQSQNRLLLVCRDIQDKKENDSKLIESLERLNLVTENVQDNIAIINQQGKLEYVNKIQKHTAVFPDVIIGQDAGILVYPADNEKIRRFTTECYQKGHSVTMHRAVDAPTGEIRWFETLGNTFKDKDGNLKLLTISRDISERKKIEGLLENENVLLKEIDKMRKDFVLNATHELKTPLSIIIGATDFLSRYYSDIPDTKRIEFLSSIRKGSTRLKQLIETLLDYSRLESGRLQLQQLEDADIGEMIQTSIQNLAYLINRRQQEITLNVPKNILANVDKFRIEQVIVNLISNAVKNTQPGGMIHVKLASTGDNVQFSVTDTGVGLTQDEMTRIFKKFGKIERKGLDADIDIQGTGLGLFISKEIVEMHQGKIWAESGGRNRGSTFSFSIPVKEKRKA